MDFVNFERKGGKAVMNKKRIKVRRMFQEYDSSRQNLSGSSEKDDGRDTTCSYSEKSILL